MSSVRRKCGYCQDAFSYTYLSEHQKVCQMRLPKDKSFNISWSDSDSTSEEQELFQGHNNDAGGFFSNLEDEGEEDRQEMLETLIDEIEYDELVNSYQVEVPVNNENIQFCASISTLVTWLCLFLALWQYMFSTTDNALEHLIKFLKAFFSVLAKRLNGLESFSLLLPSSLYLFQKMVNGDANKFEKYVVCIKCLKLYKFENCVRNIRGVPTSKHCNNVLYPNHTQRPPRRPCGQTLLMRSATASGKTVLHPLKTYCYLPLKDSVKTLISKKGFLEDCELWRKRITYDGVMSDIYDGKIWKEFVNNGFLSQKQCYGLMLNLDWFCPYKHVKKFSVRAFYAVVANLPRSERFKRENVILIGLIPSMATEPKPNNFIQPLIEELQVAWTNGFVYNNIQHSKENPVIIRLAVLLVVF